MTTLAPLRARRAAVARPRPDAPPVTNAIILEAGKTVARLMVG